jgi:Trypsin-like peptidase domain
MNRRILGIAVTASLFFVAATVSAQQASTKTIAKSQSKLLLDMPGLSGGREIFEYYGWDPAYKFERSYAAQASSTGRYPRAQVYLTVLRPGYVWTHENVVDEAAIKKSVPFFKERTITVEVADQGGQNRTVPHVRSRFSVDGAKCIWIKATEGGMDAASAGAGAGGGGQYDVSGFYCGPVGQTLSESDVAAVLAGWRYVPNPSGRGAATALAPAPVAPANPPVAAQRKRERAGSGSGFVVSKSGHLLTNAHVIEGCAEVRVTSPDRTTAKAEIVARDQRADLALLKSAAAPGAVASFREGQRIRQGDSVIALGFPLHGVLASEANVSPGAVSAMAGLRNDPRHLQITAPIQPGNSGGPLMDASGNVVGIVVAKLNALRVAGITGDIPQNVNFAIKAELATGFMQLHGVAPESARSTVERKAADVGEDAKRFTLLIECWK